MKIQWRLRISDLNYGNFQPFLNKKRMKRWGIFSFQKFLHVNFKWKNIWIYINHAGHSVHKSYEYCCEWIPLSVMQNVTSVNFQNENYLIIDWQPTVFPNEFILSLNSFSKLQSIKLRSKTFNQFFNQKLVVGLKNFPQHFGKKINAFQSILN